jgi:hypothetical protein
MFTDAEIQLVRERGLKYQGTAKINLNQIVLHLSASREFDPKTVGRLREIFVRTGCERLDIRNYVSAVVLKQHLESCNESGIAAKPFQPLGLEVSFPPYIFAVPLHSLSC